MLMNVTKNIKIINEFNVEFIHRTKNRMNTISLVQLLFN